MLHVSFISKQHNISATQPMYMMKLMFLSLSKKGNAIQTMKSNDAVKVVSVRGTNFEAADAEGGSASSDKGKN